MKTKVFLIILFLSMTAGASADEYTFDCENATINGSIRYTVIGKYEATFEQCSGRVDYDASSNEIRSVRLEIDVGSITSNCDWCDKIVLSEQLLDAENYPKIIYTSDNIFKEDGEHISSGLIEMHGVVDDLRSPFQFEVIKEGAAEKELKAKGQWVINRKDFGIVWNKLLDRGGVLVANHITVDWEIAATQKKE